MILVTGAAGFIGSNVAAELEFAGHDVAACDWFETGEKWRNVAKRRLAAIVPPESLLEFLNDRQADVEAVIHMGAISATTERDVDRLVRLNVQATLSLWDWAAGSGVPFVYASSGATYGGIETGFSDDNSPATLGAFRPLNAYGWSKKATDDIIARTVVSGGPAPPQWAGLKFFNVYGPNEYHKDDMRSVVSKMFDAASAGETVRLFKSDRVGVADGEQRRDFVYVKDCVATVLWLLAPGRPSGIFNLGTGRAQSFLEMFRAMEQALDRELPLEFIDMPPALQGRYQYFTEADMSTLKSAGLPVQFRSLESGVSDYVRSHLSTDDAYV